VAGSLIQFMSAGIVAADFNSDNKLDLFMEIRDSEISSLAKETEALS